MGHALDGRWGNSAAVEEGTSICGIALTHLEAGPVLLHAELVEDGRKGVMERRSSYAADDPILIFADAAKYHARILERNPWLQIPSSPHPLHTVHASSTSSSIPTTDPSCARDSDASEPLAPTATILHNAALGMETWQVPVQMRACMRECAFSHVYAHPLLALPDVGHRVRAESSSGKHRAIRKLGPSGGRRQVLHLPRGLLLPHRIT